MQPTIFAPKQPRRMDNKSARPQLELPPTTADRVLDALAIVALIALVVLPVSAYGELPDRMPKHFGLNGEADAWGAKNSIWILPAIGAGVFGLLTFLNRKPHTFNYLSKITPENAEFQYRNAMTMIRVLRLLILLTFLYFVWGTLRIGQGQQTGLGEPVSLLMVLVIDAAALYFVVRSLRHKP